MSNQEILDSLNGSEIAIIGMAGRFPGAKTPDEFWQNLRDGVESIVPYDDDALRAAGVDEKTLRHPGYVKSGAPLGEMEMFDAPFFGLGPQDAAIMDPQHRHFLEVSWEALESAGYDPARFDGLIGVYGGSGMNAYMPYNLFTNPDFMAEIGLFHIRHTGNDKDFLTTRVSYRFNLKGPSVNVQTACSTSLVAMHMAALSLLNGECDMALAGGVTIELPHRHGYIYREKDILSPDGHCRAFDADSQGTVFGSGAGAVVLRRLGDAIEAGDTIHAVIRGSAINNDGAGKASYFAPSPDGQSKAIAEALGISDVPAESISYIETHGTGTTIGDDIEIKGLTQAFRTQTNKNQFIPIGSVKTNIGHLDTAAGVASIIKAVQALKHKQLPPSLNFKRHNPEIDFENSPFFVNSQLTDWQPPANTPRRAGVSSLGVGGTNAHIILEEAPVLEPSSESRSYQVLMLAARTTSALDKMTANLAAHLQAHPEQNLADVAYTLQMGRQHFKNRRIIVVADHADAVEIIEANNRQRIFSHAPDRELDAPQIAFMFPGGGAQYPNMGRDLYEQEPLYREVVDECLTILASQVDFDLRALIFPDEDDVEQATSVLEQTHSAGLPALFITEYAMAKLLMSWGIQPATFTGHSMGEYTAACLAGVMSLKDALSIVTVRGKLFETLPEGAMLSVPLPEAEVVPMLMGDLNIAVINSPSSCVISGHVEQIDQMEQILTDKGIEVRRVRIAVAAHSAMLEPILAEFYQHVARIRLNPPTMPYITNLTGTWVRPEDATNPQYWVDHLRHTVRFADGMGTLLDSEKYLLLEVGPGNTLSSLARQHPAKSQNQVILAAGRHPREAMSDLQFLLTTLGRLWLYGQPVDWSAFYEQEQRYRVTLPTYAFDHQRYWIEPGKSSFAAESSKPILAKLDNLNDWFYKTVWKPANKPVASASAMQEKWLVFVDDYGLGHDFVAQLRAAGASVVTVTPGYQYGKRDHSYTIDPRQLEDYEDLIADLAERDLLPQRIAHLWSITPPDKLIRSRLTYFEETSSQGFYSLLFLAQALANEAITEPMNLFVMADGVQQVSDEAVPYPEKATLLGPVRVIPQEFPNITVTLVDLNLPVADANNGNGHSTSAHGKAHLLQALQNELTAEASNQLVAYRGEQRWQQSLEPAPIAEGSASDSLLRPGGVYLITGGLGGIGLTHAEYLAKNFQAKLILVNRSALPPRDQWNHWLNQHAPQDATSRKIRKVLALEASGAEVMVCAADVSHRSQLGSVIEQAVGHFGTIYGVIHAAGVLEDGLIQTKTLDAVERVFSPKIRGALLLDDLLSEIDLDFFVVFSSTSTVIGAAGQIDYIAANAFLNAFARSKSQQSSTFTASINWGLWQEVGMAVAAAANAGLIESQEPPSGQPMAHPLLDLCIVDTPDEIVYTTEYSVDRYWILDQHRIKDGEALIPGTGYLEILKAALEKDRPQGTVEIQDLFFIAPLEVQGDEKREVRVSLNQDGDVYAFSVTSRAHFDEEWLEHARGKIGYSLEKAPAPLDIMAILDRCQQKEITFGPGKQFTKQEMHLNFGPRWKNLRRMNFGQGEAIAHLELLPEFRADIAAYKIHPALMDLATGFPLPLIAGYEEIADLFVPLTYKHVRIYRDVPDKIYSYVQLANNSTDTPAFDIIIVDTQGNVCVEINSFTVKRVDRNKLIASNVKSAKRSHKPQADSNGKPNLLQLALTDGIAPAEGTQLFQRVINARREPEIIISSLDLQVLVDMNRASSIAKESGGLKFARPENMQSNYSAPTDDIETRLAAIWQSVLGIDQIGVHDDFFELGGESLVAGRLFTQIKKMFGVDLPLDTLFQAPTIALCAELLRSEVEVEKETKKETRKKRSSRSSLLVTINSEGAKPPFFCIHDLNGYVLYYRDLARHMRKDRPFYAVQAMGLDNKHAFDQTIDAMSSRYLDEIRSAQPQGPYYLGGSSLGGLIAFDMAQKLLADGQEVAMLALFDSWTPQYLYELLNPQYEPESIRAKATRHLSQLLTAPADYLTQRVKNRSGWQEYQQELQRLEGLRAEVERHLETGEPMPDDLRSFYKEEIFGHAYQSYQPQPYPGKMTLFVAEERTLGDFDPNLGWGSKDIFQLETHKAPGPHGFMVREPHVRGLADQLQACIDKAEGVYSQPNTENIRLS